MKKLLEWTFADFIINMTAKSGENGFIVLELKYIYIFLFNIYLVGHL